MPSVFVMRPPVVVGWLGYGTVTPATGNVTATFAAPVSLLPSVDYWVVMQLCATNMQRDPTVVRSGISSPDGMVAHYSLSGGGFASVDTGTAYVLFTLNRSGGGASKSITQPTPTDYWGPSSVTQKFQVDAAIDVASITAYWGGAAATGKFGIAASLLP